MRSAAVPDAAHPAHATAWPVLVLACVLAGALRLALGAASGASLHVDEAQYWDWSRDLQWGYFSKPPLIAALIAASTHWFGDSESGLRALCVACYPLTALTLAVWAHDMAGDDPAGPRPAAARMAAARWAAAIFLCSPLAALVGLVATTDAPLLLCWALALAGLWAAAVRGRPWGWLLLALAGGLGLLAKYTTLALWAGAWCWVLAGRRQRSASRLPLAGACAGALMIVAPHLAWNAAQGWPTWRHTAEITVGLPARDNGGAAGTAGYLLTQGAVFAPLLVPVLLLMVAGWLRRGARMVSSVSSSSSVSSARPATFKPALPFLGWTSLPLLLAGAWLAWHAGVQLNWVAPLHLACALALALWLARDRGQGQRRLQRQVALLLALQALLLTGLSLAPRAAAALGRPWPALLDPWARMRGWPQAFEQAALALRSQPGVQVVGSSRAVMAQAAYHWRGQGIERAAWRGSGRPSHHYQLHCPFEPRAPHDGGLVVLADGPVPAALSAELGLLGSPRQWPVAMTPTRQISLSMWRAAPAGGPATAAPGPTCR